MDPRDLSADEARLLEKDSEVEGLYRALPDRAKEDFLLALRRGIEVPDRNTLLSYT